MLYLFLIILLISYFLLIFPNWKLLSFILRTSLVKISFEFYMFYLIPYWTQVSNLLIFLMGEVSLKLIFIRIWIFMFRIFVRIKIFNFNLNQKFFISNLILMIVIVILCFSTINILLLYILFETSIFPIMFIIIVWRYQPERLIAVNYFFFYTVLCSLPFLGVALFFIMKSKSIFLLINFYLIYLIKRTIKYLFLFILLAKALIYMLHLWLPKAHIEAPVRGPIILAGILLKFGTYGLLRLIEINFIGNFNKIVLIRRFLWGTVITCLICLRQLDLKSLIAYSSVSHMTFLCGRLITINTLG